VEALRVRFLVTPIKVKIKTPIKEKKQGKKARKKSPSG